MSGIVLAAGASSRMGRPKSLLPLPDGRFLAAAQAARLRAAGCSDTLIVLGADADSVAARLGSEPLIVHPDWTRGRCGSMQAGLRARPGADACLILPVDNVLIRTSTLGGLLAAAQQTDRAVRPWRGDLPGRALWLSAAAGADLLAAPPDARVDELLRPLERRLPVDDAGAASDINTPADWETARRMLGAWGAGW